MDKKDGIEKIHKLMDELAAVTKDIFPDYTRISVDCAKDGYRTFTILKWGNGKTAETTPRRELFQQTKVSAKYDWEADRSQDQNEYLEKLGLLMKDDV